MPDTDSQAPDRFPFATALAALLALFLFLGLVLVAYYSVPREPEVDPAMKLQQVKARNRAVLDGTDASSTMSVGKATAEMLSHADRTKDEKHKYGKLPFPAEPKAPPPAEKKP